MSSPEGWVHGTVGECLTPTSFRRQRQLQTREYRQEGRFPIIDQGQSDIAGWTDDEAAVIDAPLPVVVFGDHSRTLKYVDFPFVRGADGTQVMAVTEGLDPRFFYYACKFIDVPARGYNRHFGQLKESSFARPESLGTQQAIASAMRSVEEAIALESSRLEAASVIKLTAMTELFSRGLRGEEQKETSIGLMPSSWRLHKLGDIGRIGNGTTPNRQHSAYWAGGTMPWITSGRMYERRICGSDTHVTELAISECSLPRLLPGAVLIAIVGQGKTLGHCAILAAPATVSRHVGFIQPKPDLIRPEFLAAFLEFRYEHLRQLAAGNGSTRAALTCAILRDVEIPLPALAEQEEIHTLLDAIDAKIALHQQKRAVLEELFKALLHKLMTGEIDVNDLDLSALQPAT